MRLSVDTLDEREAMELRRQGWKFKSMNDHMWVLEWPDAKRWPPDYYKDAYK